MAARQFWAALLIGTTLAGMPAVVPQAQAQRALSQREFFELFFPGMRPPAQRERRREVEPRRQPQGRARVEREDRVIRRPRRIVEDVDLPRPRRQASESAPPRTAKPIKPIEAPQVYTYKPARFVALDTAAMLARSDAGQAGADADFGPPLPAVLAAASASGAADSSGRSEWEQLAEPLAQATLSLEPDIAKAMVEFYGRERRALWLDADLQPNARAEAALEVLAQADRMGLDPADYATARPGLASEADAARFELELSARAVRYMQDASGGLIDPNRLSGYHDLPSLRMGAGKALTQMTSGSDIRATMLAAHPASSEFNALVDELAALGNETGRRGIAIPDTTMIRPGQTSEQVRPLLAAIAVKASPDLADMAEALLDAEPALDALNPEAAEIVRAFQAEKGLRPDGVVGPATLRHLNDLDATTRQERVLLAMERLRWHPHDLGSRYVFLNQPSFTATYMVDGQPRISMRTVIGSRETQTNFFYDTIETVEYNPYWGVPQSILVNEFLPKLRANPSYLDQRGYEITDGRGKQVPGSAIDWHRYSNAVPFNVRQSPGEANALGELKILFPNKHAIYMHDTPQRALFARDSRAFSHGCVRLEKPREMAAALLGTDVDHVAARLRKGHNQEQVPGNIAVYVSYFTAWPSADGKVDYFADIYGRDEHLRTAIEATRAQRSTTG